MHDDFTMRTPEVLARDMEALVDRYSQKPIIVLETVILRGGLRQQLSPASSVRERGVRGMGIDTAGVSASRYHKYYGLKHPRFANFPSTLGLRMHPGADRNKPGFLY